VDVKVLAGEERRELGIRAGDPGLDELCDDALKSECGHAIADDVPLSTMPEQAPPQHRHNTVVGVPLGTMSKTRTNKSAHIGFIFWKWVVTSHELLRKAVNINIKIKPKSGMPPAAEHRRPRTS